MPWLLVFFISISCLFQFPSKVLAQQLPTRQTSLSAPNASSALPIVATDSAQVATISAQEQQILEKLKKEDITKPEETPEKQEFIALFSKRPITRLGITNFFAFLVQSAVLAGVPANTIMLIFLLPLLATIIVFTRQIVGLPSLEVFVPIALAITLVSTGILAGAILLATILLASTFSRIILKRVRIMQLPKMAISMLIVALFVFIVLVASASSGLVSVRQLSFFPILLLILLSDKIVALQLTKSLKETVVITIFTLGLGFLGYLLLTFNVLRQYLLLYPELIFLLIPINLVMGRYFGLRLVEFYRFSAIRKYANQ